MDEWRQKGGKMEDEYNIASEIKSETKVAGKLLVSTVYFLCFY